MAIIGLIKRFHPALPQCRPHRHDRHYWELVIGWRGLQRWIVGRHAGVVVALGVIGLPVKAIPEPPLNPRVIRWWNQIFVAERCRHPFLPLLRKRIGYAIAQ